MICRGFVSISQCVRVFECDLRVALRNGVDVADSTRELMVCKSRAAGSGGAIDVEVVLEANDRLSSTAPSNPSWRSAVERSECGPHLRVDAFAPPRCHREPSIGRFKMEFLRDCASDCRDLGDHVRRHNLMGGQTSIARHLYGRPISESLGEVGAPATKPWTTLSTAQAARRLAKGSARHMLPPCRCPVGTSKFQGKPQDRWCVFSGSQQGRQSSPATIIRPRAQGVAPLPAVAAPERFGRPRSRLFRALAP
jgi:hypothetical protein